MLPKSLLAHLEQILHRPIVAADALSGGDIHRAARLRTDDGRDMFVKFNTGDQAPEMFRTEALGLALLGTSRLIATPKVPGNGPGYVAPVRRFRSRFLPKLYVRLAP